MVSSRFLPVVVLLVAGGPGMAAAAQRDLVSSARQFYNDGMYDAAIAAAQAAVHNPRLAEAARLILGRAHLERYRQSAERQDLEAGRDALRAINPTALTPPERVELLVGLGEALYLDERYGPAAEVFATILDRPELSAVGAGDRVLDWWATSLDRLGQMRSGAERQELYGRVLDQMERELLRDPGSTPASYWLAAAARGAGNLERAWHAAIAGWVRAPLARDRGAALRADLDRLVLEAIIPERARRIAGRDAVQVEAAMRAEWSQIKERW
jgi:hypothetical protein